MKKLSLLLGSLLLVGAGCAVGQQAEFQAQTPPAAEPAKPAQPATGTGQAAQPAVPATPPSGGIKAEVEANLPPVSASVKVSAGASFAPATIKVKAGDTVTWNNDGSSQIWVASDPHPSHTDYPGFDQKGSMSAGSSYSFTFTKKGTWGYHNHLNPSMRGTVIVE